MNTIRLPRTLQKLSKHPTKTIMSLLQLHKRFAALALLIVVVTLYLVNARPPTEIESLPGWQADTYHPPSAQRKESPWMEVLNAEARIFLYHNFLAPEEADHIISLAAPALTRSDVVDTDTGKEVESQVRTSRGTFLSRGQDKVVKDIEERIARWTLLPVGNGEGLQVLRYENGQHYDGHFDYFFHEGGTSNGGNRYATVLMYLADTEEGGETTFPNVPAPNGINEGFSECARYTLAAKPRKGDAILFHSMQPNGDLERRSLHEACPVLKGVKWSAAKWIHVGHYAMGNEKPQEVLVKSQVVGKEVAPGVFCKDQNPSCFSWSEAGECKKNSGFMVGTARSPGACLASCGRCDLLTTNTAK
eukprot:jgi/Botrbrau1/18353/Bobra.0179s0078.1